MATFEDILLGKINDMQTSMKNLETQFTGFKIDTQSALVDLSGKIKGNHELIVKDLDSYIDNPACEVYRDKLKDHVASIEERLSEIEAQVKYHLIETNKDSEKKKFNISQWLVAGGIIFLLIFELLPYLKG